MLEEKRTMPVVYESRATDSGFTKQTSMNRHMSMWEKKAGKQSIGSFLLRWQSREDFEIMN